MEWRCDDARLDQLCQMFAAASSPETHVQQQVMQLLNQFSQLPDFNMYLVTIFVARPGQQEIVRQRAGLLLKTNMLHLKAGSLEPTLARHIQAQALQAMQDPSRTIRRTAGTILTTMVQALGFSNCGATLEQLVSSLGSQNPEVVEGCLSALSKICEDLQGHLTVFASKPTEQSRILLQWCAQQVLPRVFECVSPSAPPFARLSAVECLGHFATSGNLTHEQYPELRQYSTRYIEVLGMLANDTTAEILQCVCKGFAAAVENGWECLTDAHYDAILKFMLKASMHPEYNVRWEALAVWAPCAALPQSWGAVRGLLPELVPVLLANMVYSQADYMCLEPSQLEDDNAGVPDALDDIKPRFHRDKQGGDPDDEEDSKPGGAWGSEWTARKAAAFSLDNLTSLFQADIIPIVLPLIQQKLEHSSWDHQESGVLALGAIAVGGIEPLAQFLPRVLDLLVGLCNTARKPLLRSISCWCISRFAPWICRAENQQRDQILGQCLHAVLQRCLDRNKRVQEAACSAIGVMEEAALVLLAPHLDVLVETFVKAFQLYQPKNLRILYDAVGTLAWTAGKCLGQPQYVQAIMGPVMHKFEHTPDNDITAISLFECVAYICQSLGQAVLPMIPRFIERCLRVVQELANPARMWEQNPSECEAHGDLVAASVDLLAGIMEGLGPHTREVLAKQNFLVVLPICVRNSATRVKQSGFALMGITATTCHEAMVPLLPDLLPLCATGLVAGMPPNVSNNAAWAIGEICYKVGAAFMQPYLQTLVPALVGVITRRPGGDGCGKPWQHFGQTQLVQNVCITLGRLGVICGAEMGKYLPTFLEPWCNIMRSARLSPEKVNALQGLCLMVKANSQPGLSCFPQLAAAICSVYPAPQHLEPTFREILHGYRQALAAQWPMMYPQLPAALQERLQVYQLGP